MRRSFRSQLLVFSNLSGMDGSALLGRLRERRSNLPVIVISGSPSVEAAVRALTAGAHDDIDQPVDLAELGGGVLARSRREVERLRDNLRTPPRSGLGG